MAITTVTVTDLTLNTESADLNTAAFGTLGTLITAGADGFNVDLSTYGDKKITFIFTDQWLLVILLQSVLKMDSFWGEALVGLLATMSKIWQVQVQGTLHTF